MSIENAGAAERAKQTLARAQRALTEIDASNLIIDAQRAAGESIDPAGAKRLVRALVAVGLLHFP